MLFPGQADHNVKAVPPRGVQEPARRHGVGADRVQAVRRHQSEVPLDNFRVPVLVAAYTGTKGSVGRAANVELVLAQMYELASHVRTDIHRHRYGSALAHIYRATS